MQKERYDRLRTSRTLLRGRMHYAGAIVAMNVPAPPSDRSSRTCTPNDEPSLRRAVNGAPRSTSAACSVFQVVAFSGSGAALPVNTSWVKDWETNVLSAAPQSSRAVSFAATTMPMASSTRTAHGSASDAAAPARELFVAAFFTGRDFPAGLQPSQTAWMRKRCGSCCNPCGAESTSVRVAA